MGKSECKEDGQEVKGERGVHSNPTLPPWQVTFTASPKEGGKGREIVKVGVTKGQLCTRVAWGGGETRGGEKNPGKPMETEGVLHLGKSRRERQEKGGGVEDAVGVIEGVTLEVGVTLGVVEGVEVGDKVEEGVWEGEGVGRVYIARILLLPESAT